MRRSLALIVAAALVAGIAGYLFYFAWPAPLLDPSRIDAFAYGPEGVNPLEYVRHESASGSAEAALLGRILALVNEAPLSREPVRPREGQLLLILYRDDGLQYHLIQNGPRVVGLAEGDRGYLAALDSPGLAALLDDLKARGDGLTSGS
ncbi:MAG: hypothetical protein M5U22_13835 [Thermoleophilia bacterium]|nr:hypothetical protein [Thermoleophilia bacterium]